MTTTQKLVLELCKFRHPNIKKIDELLFDNPDLATVLGHLLQNRVTGAAYETLCKTDALALTDPPFCRILKTMYDRNRQRTKAYKNALQRMDEILAYCRGSYAMLKGANLCGVYPEGLRTSNDIDLLIEKKDLSKIENALKAAGLSQGYVKNGKFVPATRKEIIFSNMMKGETVPYVFETGDSYMPYLEIDLNFALGYKTRLPKESILCWKRQYAAISAIMPLKRFLKRIFSFTSARISTKRQQLILGWKWDAICRSTNSWIFICLSMNIISLRLIGLPAG